MNQHRYLRAYMAGIVAPTLFLLVVLAAFCVARFALKVPAPIERVIVFPMAIIPNVFGLWNMLYIKLHPQWHTPIGLHGALLPFVLAPLGFFTASSLGLIRMANGGVLYFNALYVPYGLLVFVPLIAIALYYLVWKYIVGSLNALVGLA